MDVSTLNRKDVKLECNTASDQNAVVKNEDVILVTDDGMNAENEAKKASRTVNRLHNDKLIRCEKWLEIQNVVLESNEYLEDPYGIDVSETESNSDDNDSKQELKKRKQSDIDASHLDDFETLTIIPVKKLRTEGLNLECEWQTCQYRTSNYEEFQKHVKCHMSELYIINQPDKELKYLCLWDICGHECTNPVEIRRHVNYHSYHTRLLAAGLNARRTLGLRRCCLDSSKRNFLPPLLSNFVCLWSGCRIEFVAIQDFIDHVTSHVNGAEHRAGCLWLGCGAAFARAARLLEHVRAHTQERYIACAHCGKHFANNTKLRDHVDRQNDSMGVMYKCGACGRGWPTARLLRDHSRHHVSTHACSHCDMTAPSLTALAAHIRYRHLSSNPSFRPFACGLCSHTSVTKWDLDKHVETHDKSKPTAKTKKKEVRQYVCHVCTGTKPRFFARGYSLTRHLVKEHGIQWPFGHSRFRYQKGENGWYQLTTTRYESLEVSSQIMKGGNGSYAPPAPAYEYEVVKKINTDNTVPTSFVVQPVVENPDQPASLQIDIPSEESLEVSEQEQDLNIHGTPQANLTQKLQILLADVDAKGNVIKSQLLSPDCYEFG